MNNARFWETPDELMTISLCSEGCLHLRVGRAIIKLTREEFLALTNLANTAVRDLLFSGLTAPGDSGH
jgi:hypothetical protein